MDTLQVALHIVGLVLTSLALARSKLFASAVWIHFTSHGQVFENPQANTWAAAFVGISSFSPTPENYGEDHSPHHRNSTFATLLDPDGKLMWDLGFRAGKSYAKLKRLFWWTLVSPRLHGPMSWARLRHTFGPDQPRWRRAAAFALWGGLGLAAWAGGWLPGLLGGVVMPLLVFGNISTFVELASEHKWHLKTESVGKARQFSLSHGRNLLDWLPDEGAPWWRWLWMPVALLLAVAARWTLLPGDLSNHLDHHMQSPKRAHLHRYGWLNSAYEYSPNLAESLALALQRFGSVLAAVYAWLLALSREPS